MPTIGKLLQIADSVPVRDETFIIFVEHADFVDDLNQLVFFAHMNIRVRGCRQHLGARRERKAAVSIKEDSLGLLCFQIVREGHHLGQHAA